jgi:hypothetical protein
VSKPKDSDHIEDMLEWENKQYAAWEYAQEGKFPPSLKAVGNKKLAAILFFIQGGISVILIAIVILTSSKLAEIWPELLFPAAIAALCFMAAANYMKSWKAAKLQREKASQSRKN